MPHERLTYGDIELPLYSGQVIAESKSDMEARAADPTSKRMLRNIVASLRYSNIISLGEFLERADQTFETIAAACGASVVDHKWGLATSPADKHHNWAIGQALDILPIDYRLIADVEVLHNTIPLSPRLAMELNGVVNRLKPGPDDLKWDDMGAHQFLEHESGLVLVDIEPEFAGMYKPSRRA